MGRWAAFHSTRLLDLCVHKWFQSKEKKPKSKNIHGSDDVLDFTILRQPGPYALKLLLMETYVAISHIFRSPARRIEMSTKQSVNYKSLGTPVMKRNSVDWLSQGENAILKVSGLVSLP